MVGLTIASLLAVGVVAVAGNGFGASATSEPLRAATGDCDFHERDTDGDRILNCEDPDWVRPLDGRGYGESKGYGQNLSGIVRWTAAASGVAKVAARGMAAAECGTVVACRSI